MYLALSVEATRNFDVRNNWSTWSRVVHLQYMSVSLEHNISRHTRALLWGSHLEPFTKESRIFPTP